MKQTAKNVITTRRRGAPVGNTNALRHGNAAKQIFKTGVSGIPNIDREARKLRNTIAQGVVDQHGSISIPQHYG